ncbi:MAG TPA: zinc ribbon domain-containing protein [Verrucomicrobiae bacterium]|jgi:hypothetical protein|nr:zinc ribbon domain-containing protein [Verrucomicrobiae bacterium]
MPTILFIPRIPLPLPAGRSAPAKLLACPDCGTAIRENERNCPGCGRIIERAAGRAVVGELTSLVGGLTPTAAGAWLILAVLLVVVVGGPIYWWRSQLAQVPKPETESQQFSRLQSEAESRMLEESTNVIVGLNRIIRVNSSTSDDNPHKWTGDVTAEFVNKVGGVERTNILFKFGTDTGTDGLMHLRCSTETDAERHNRQRGDRREFGRWDRSLHQ